MTVLESLQPREVLSFFETLAGIPRGSGNEERVAEWVVRFARERGLEAVKDDMHCVLVRKPGQGGLEDAPPLILHGHLDMVCEKEEGVSIDFENDPIRLVVEGDYITADGTSLGADNGIGVSYILALLDSKDIPHPPLEAVLTAMEEKGKYGAGRFDTSQLTGKRMIDFNWITDKEILAGCSGDVTMTIDVPAQWEDAPATHPEARLLKVRGLAGGHCEFDIHLERANALLVLARVLTRALDELDVRIADPTGGAQNNAIPADAQVVLALRPEDVAGVEEVVARVQGELEREYERADPGIRLELEPAEQPERVFSAEAGARLARLVSLVPNGVISWNLAVPGRVETSNNLGTIRTTDDGARLMSTITSALTSRKHEVFDRVRALAALAGGGVGVEQYGLDAPEFAYEPDSPLLKVASEAYRDVIGEEPEVEVSQCSLELGIFSNTLGLDTISIGTELHDLHNPKETVSHRSVAKVWPLVREVVGRLGR
ncbi:beta-Ala-His dipeptidase [Quadrisphaera sp. DSM 44207]|uniref:beta-Ala-His dipeptidase n=1 Tax=Quadrisphaera sp. DSM 44207 TaxID=1881057 RepID=UPI00087E79AD|nr:beta-Ala-His dipeptidase [Quadrisphaera sp. DSM 44207]SDQ83459.1 dipeptidase D [Quadrisphaera sp. DSM 44207]